MKLTKKLKKTINTLYNIAEKNNFSYWCKDITEYNSTLSYDLMTEANLCLQAILKGNRDIKEFQ